MKLEMATFPVKDVRFGARTDYKDGILQINRDELVKLVLEDKKIASAQVEVVFPGEKTRVVNIRDVVEPRVKVSGPGCVFPGIMGPLETVGQGRTHRLSGITVIPSALYKPTILSGTSARSSSVLDMWGPGATVSPFASTINVVIIFKLKEVTELEAQAVIQSAEFRVAQRLAETTKDLPPVEMEVFDISKTDPSLPKIAYILSFVTHWHHPHTFVAYYGVCVRESMPTFIHPNELLDGALTPDARKGSGIFTATWYWQNQPVALGLLREHGKRLNFLGVILQRTRFEAEQGKKMSAAGASQMAKLLGADGVILTKTTGSGASFEDVMLTLEACEKKDLKTVLLTAEWGGPDGTEPPLVLYAPEAVSLVTTGSVDRGIELPAPESVIGCGKLETAEATYAGDPDINPWGPLMVLKYGLTGGIDWWGARKLTCLQY